MKKGFTLIELVLVIAILGILATLAVMRVGNLREKSARTVSLANQSAVGRAVDAFLTIDPNGRINYLDSLLDDEVALGDGNGFDVEGTSVSSTGAGFYLGPDDVGYPIPEAYSDKDVGLTPRVVNQVLIPYSLNSDEVSRLANRDFKFVMRHATRALQSPSAAYGEYGDDGARLSTSDTIGLDPHKSACIARAVTNRMVVAAISPFTPAGREIYRSCGQKLLDTETTKAAYVADRVNVLAQVKATGGALLAFGLGSDATLIGAGLAGLEAVPYATYPLAKFYRQYILLFRVNTSTPAGRVDFMGVLDPCGFTIAQAREALQQ